jgi:hypothetical protein
MDFLELKKYSRKLQSMDDDAIKKFCSLTFSNREGILSVSVASRDKKVLMNAFKEVIFPKDFFNEDYVMWGIDLESIGTDSIRIYRTNPKSNKVRIEGFYIDRSGKILEKKIYARSSDGLVINRYDSKGILISSGEAEVNCRETDWSGSKELVNDVKKGGYKINFLKKTLKNQTYLVVHKLRG